MIEPRWFSVAALYCLQNSMVCTPCGPRAVPTGGAGVAPPAGSWIFTIARTLFLGGITFLLVRTRRAAPSAARQMSELGDLAELELDGRLTPEDVHENLELRLVFVDLGDLAREVGERTFFHPHGLALFVLESRAGLLRGLDTLDLDLQDALDLAPRKGEG